jgi:hypothetical protein
MAVNRRSASDLTDAAAIAEVTRTVEDYFIGWYDGDPERMRRALHPDLAKRSYIGQGDGPPVLRAVTADLMIGWTADGQGREDDPDRRHLTIVVDDIHDTIATARVESAIYREYVHLARTADGWRVVNTLWAWTDPAHPGT